MFHPYADKLLFTLLLMRLNERKMMLKYKKRKLYDFFYILCTKNYLIILSHSKK